MVLLVVGLPNMRSIERFVNPKFWAFLMALRASLEECALFIKRKSSSKKGKLITDSQTLYQDRPEKSQSNVGFEGARTRVFDRHRSKNVTTAS